MHCMTLFTMKVRIIELRYGRVDMNGGIVGELAQIRETYKQISVRVGRPLSTVYSIVKRFERKEYILDLKRPKRERPNAQKLTA